MWLLLLVLLSGIELLASLFLFPEIFFPEYFQFVLAVFSTSKTDSCNVLVFHSGGTLVWVCQHYCLWHVGSQCLIVARLELPNHWALTPFLGVWQSVHTCHSPNGPDLLISSGVAAFCHIWIVRWWHGQLFRMRLWPVFEVHQENLLTFDLPEWRQVSRICILLLPLIEILRTSFEKLPDFLPISPGLGH